MEENIEKSEITGEKQINRIPDEKGRMVFAPGVSGNPNGRPKGSRSFTTKVKQALEKIADGKDYSYEEAFIKAILKKAIVDQDPQIMRLIWNYLDGMPLQNIGFDNLDIQSVKIEINRPINGTKPTSDNGIREELPEQSEDNNQ